MSVSDEEVRRAADRMKKHLDSPFHEGMKRESPYWRPSGWIAAGGRYNTDQMDADRESLALAYMQELARRDAEASARSKPIDDLWLASIGGQRSGLSWFWPEVRGRYEHGEWRIGCDKLRDVRNRGELLDVLKGLVESKS